MSLFFLLTLSTTKKNLISKASGASLFFNELIYTAHSYCFAKTRLSKKDSPQDSWLMVQTCITMNFRISNTSCKVSDLSLHIQTKKCKQSTVFFTSFWFQYVPNSKGMNDYECINILSPRRSSRRSNSSPRTPKAVEKQRRHWHRRVSTPRRSPDRLVDVRRTSLWGIPVGLAIKDGEIFAVQNDDQWPIELLLTY